MQQADQACFLSGGTSMSFILGYTIFIDAIALLALIFLAGMAVYQQKSAGLAVLALAVSFWAVIRLFNFI